LDIQHVGFYDETAYFMGLRGSYTANWPADPGRLHCELGS